MSDQQFDIWPIVIDWGQGTKPDCQQMAQLKTWLAASGQADVWQTAADLLQMTLDSRGRLLQSFVQQLNTDGVTLPLAGNWTDWVEPLWQLWLPLAQYIDSQQRALNTPYIQGILGGQGTGKSTLSQILQMLLRCLGQQAVALSIDDLYLTYAERCELQRTDPRLVWRGPPGTHDVALGVKILTQIRQGAMAIQLPRFDKSLKGGQGDRTQPLIVHHPTVVLFEGWCVGARPLPESLLSGDDFVFPDPIKTPADRQFAKDCNRKLADYLPLWSFLHSLIVLKPEDYRWALQWRQAAEYKMIAKGKAGLSKTEISAFVLYFWKALHPELFITPLTVSPSTSDASDSRLTYKTSLVVNICRNQQVGSLCLP
ncbi:MAG: hypothetical protein ACFB0D_24695 [Phormidesmis sp.]